jgi:hypothetical protein
MSKSIFTTAEEAESYFVLHREEFDSLKDKFCPLINNKCHGEDCTCWEPAEVTGVFHSEPFVWYIQHARCSSSNISK